MKRFTKILDDNPVFCTAGIEYCYVAAINRIYKCNAHYSDHLHERSFELKEYEDFFKYSNELCNHVSCLDRECDIYLVEIWDSKGKRINPEKIFWRDYSSGIKEVKKQRNLHIQFEPVFGCSHRCPYCALTQSDIEKKPINFIHMFTFLKMINYVNENFNGIKQINIAGGGEPLLHPEINDIFTYCDSHDIEMFLVTSGLVGNNKYFKMADMLKNISVSLSLHPLSPFWKESKMIELIDFLSGHAKVLDCRFVLYEENKIFLPRIKEILYQRKINLIEMPYVDNLDISRKFNKFS